MRDHYHEELDAITAQLVEMTSLVASGMTRATHSLLEADLQAAESVISGDEVVDAVYRDLEARAFELLARQQPVAGDLRTLVTSLRMVADIERAGDMALHVAKIARRRYPSSAVPEELRPTIRSMGEVAVGMMGSAGRCIGDKDLDLAERMETDDDAMDELHRRLFHVLLDDAWRGGMEAAIDITLAGRYYERFADHAVSVARRVRYLVTGERV